MDNKSTGRLTIPTDVDVVTETLKTMELWGADGIRDADGTEFPEALKDVAAKVYATYYTTRKDNAWAMAHPDEVQQCYVMTKPALALGAALSIRLLAGLSDELLAVNDRDDMKRWWEVIDRTGGEVLSPEAWDYHSENGCVEIKKTKPYHEYTVSFLAYIIWDPVHMYNAVVNDWKDFEHQITFDVRQPKTKEWSKQRLRNFLRDKPYVKVVRFTTFFHQFTLLFDELKREKYVDWFGYSASVSPHILDQFEREIGYPFRAEYIIDQGYHNNQYRIPSKQYLDFMAFQRREVAALAQDFVDICHEEGREAMMFLGDHWIGTEPYMPEFKSIGLDAVVGSVGNGSTLRLISDIPGVQYTEGRFLPYFFPDTFREGGNPLAEARENWITARRALLRKPVDRIGYGGYLKLALDFPDFVDYIARVADEFRLLYDNLKGAKPYCFGRVAVLNCWGKMRSWGCHMVHHALYQKQNYSYAGVIEALSGAPWDVRFISFDDISENPEMLKEIDVLLNIGDADTAHGGGFYWAKPEIITAVRRFIAEGGGFIGVGQPSAHQWEGRFFQLAAALGVEKETGFTLGYDKYNWDIKTHFITEGMEKWDFGEGMRGVYALPGTQVLYQKDKEVQMAANDYGKGRCVYISGLPYNFDNARLLHRALLWAGNRERRLRAWFSENVNTEVHAYPQNGKYCVVNNTDQPQDTTVYDSDGHAQNISLAGGEIRWFTIRG